MIKEGALIWITGLAGSGKTTIGNYLYYSLKEHTDGVVILDGDILKTIVDSNVGYSTEERKKRAYKYAALCKALVEQGLVVICCTIAMYEEVRQKNRKDIKNYIEVFLDVPLDVLKERDKKGLYSSVSSGTQTDVPGMDLEVEFPQNPDIVIKNDGTVSVKKCVEEILGFYHEKYDVCKRDVMYWNAFYSANKADEKPSLFAQDVKKRMKSGAKLLDVGCGNGRDSVYFLREADLYVTGIDISDKAIAILNEKLKEHPKALFVCDDFTCSETIYAQQYDYIYSRFSLHAINANQEDVFLSNAYKALKDGGMLFVEVRSVNDSLYGQGIKAGEDEYINNGHYRRFIRREQLEQRMEQKGFEIIESIENADLAPYEGENPMVIRIVCKK